MADESTKTPTAVPSPRDLPDVQKLVADTVAAALAPVTAALADLGKNQKVLADTLASLPPSGAPENVKGGTGPTALSLEDVAKLLDEREAKAKAGAASAAKRAAFVAEKLKGVPEAYHHLLGDDEGKWEENAKAAREKLKADLTALGAKLPDVTGDAAPATGNAGGTPPTAKPDLSKLNADQLIALGLKQRPVQPQPIKSLSETAA